MLHRLTRSTVIRGLVILPFLISGVVAALVWSWMLQSQLGIVNIWLQDLTGHNFLFLGSPDWAIPTVALINVWKSMGYNAILLFAGLQMMPRDVYEAARLDGAGEVRIFRSITLPLLRPVLAMVVILTVISSFQVFDIVAGRHPRRRARRTPRTCCPCTSTSRPSPSSTSATPRRCPWRCS